MSGRGTKNLGLIKAIHVGVNPPLNTKILWFYDGNTPYATGPAKVHYYYDVNSSEWKPLHNDSVVGNYTYLGFSSDCHGADFSETYDENVHTHWSLIVSDTQINNVTADLFKFWNSFCEDGDTGGNYTYVGYADSCEGDNFSLEKNYTTDCGDCKELSKAERLDSSSNSINLIEIEGGFELHFTNAMAGDSLKASLKIEDEVLSPLTKYCIKAVIDNQTTVIQDGMVKFNLQDNRDTSNILTSTFDEQKFSDITDDNSLFNLWIPDTYTEKINGVIQFKIGTENCCSGITGQCQKSRKCFAILNSDTPIQNITVDNFEGLWNCICCGDTDDSGISNLKKQFELLSTKTIEKDLQHDKSIQDLYDKTNSNKVNLMNLKKNTENDIKFIKINHQEDIAKYSEIIDALNLKIQQLESRISDLENSTTHAAILGFVIPVIDQKIDDNNNNNVYPRINTVSTDLSQFINVAYSADKNDFQADQQSQDDNIEDLDNRVTALENNAN